MFWAITVLSGWVSIGADAVNPFSQWPPPSEPTYVLIDDLMWEWLKEQKCTQVDEGGVRPVQCALQGNPEYLSQQGQQLPQ
jgi:hypothetical protein